MEQEIILVNEKDEAIGVMKKMEAHQKGVLHRAFSVFIFDKKGRMLLQQRSPGKYHGGSLWTNACCSHPWPGEKTEEAAIRRLEEELGFITPLKEIFSFIYQAPVENALIEHEFDHVFAGQYEGNIIPNQNEVTTYCYEEMEQIRWGIIHQPAKFTSWFKLAFPKIDAWWNERYGKVDAG
jgi:isopentenyl-diphosphate delta-isomerase